MGTPSQSCGTSLAIWDHTLPPDTSEHAPPNPSQGVLNSCNYWGLLDPSHAGWYSIYLPRRDGRLSWPSWLDSARRESNQRPFDHESDAEPLHHQDNPRYSAESYTKLWVFEGGQYNCVTEIYHRLALVAMVTKILSSNNEIIVRCTAKGLDRHSVRQNIAYLVSFLSWV